MTDENQKAIPTIVIKQRDGTPGPMCGFNTQVFIDGVPVRGCSEVNFRVKAGGQAEVVLVLIGKVEILGQISSVTEIRPGASKEGIKK